MSILITADLHWSDKPRDSYRWDFVETLHRLIKKYKVHHVAILGDLCEEKEGHKAAFVNKICNAIYGLSQVCLITILKGNHDFIGNPDEPFFGFLGLIHNVDYINVPTIKPIGLFLPFTTDWRKDWNNGKMLRGHRRVFTHQMWQGASFGFGGIAEQGVPLEAIPDGCFAYSGDIHARQSLKKPKSIGGVTYVGAPYLVDYGDTYKPRVLLFEGDGNPISIAIKGRQKRLIELHQTNYGKKDSLFQQSNPNDLLDYGELNPGDIVKIRINVTDASKFNELKNHIYEWSKQYGVTIDGIQGVKTVELTKEKKLSKTSVFKRPDKELVQDHAKREQLDEKTLNIGLELTND